MAVLATAALLAACGSAPGPAGSGGQPTTGAGATDAPASVSVEGLLGEGAALRTVADIAAFENALVADVARAAGLPTLLGDEGWTWAEGLLRDALASAGEEVGLRGPSTLTASLQRISAEWAGRTRRSRRVTCSGSPAPTAEVAPGPRAGADC